MKFLRISSSYPKLIEQFLNNFPEIKKLSFKKTSQLFFNQYYNQSNFITLELKKLGYECMEVVSNHDILQQKWLNEFGNKDINSNILVQQIKYFKPDVLFVGNMDLIDDNFVGEIKSLNIVKIILGYHCAPLNKKIIKNINNIDAIVTCTVGYKKLFSEILKKKTLLMPHAFSKKIEIKKNQTRDIDIAFLGSLFLGYNLHEKRIEVLYSLLKKYKNNYIATNFSKFFFYQIIILLLKSFIYLNFFKRVKLIYKTLFIYFFTKKPLFGKEMYKILSRSKILINMHIKDTKYAGNMRLFEGTGSGCLLITDKIKGNNSYFKKNYEILEYSTYKELLNLCDFYLKNRDLLSKISQRGKEKTVSKHNYQLRAQTLNHFLNKILKYNKKIK